MYDLICDVISCCVWSCDIGKINVCDKIVMIKNKKEKIWKSKKFIQESQSIRRFWNGNYSLLEGALTPFSVCDAYRYLAGRTLLMSQK